jgi:hypothetical protein
VFKEVYIMVLDSHGLANSLEIVGKDWKGKNPRSLRSNSLKKGMHYALNPCKENEPLECDAS